MLDQLEPGEERRVVEGGRHLADAAPDRILEPAACGDHRRGDEPALGRPWAERLVEREPLTRAG